MVDIWICPVKPQTMNVEGYTIEPGAGRDPANVGKFHLHWEGVFENEEEAIRWMEHNSIPTEVLTKHPDVP